MNIKAMVNRNKSSRKIGDSKFKVQDYVAKRKLAKLNDSYLNKYECLNLSNSCYGNLARQSFWKANQIKVNDSRVLECHIVDGIDYEFEKAEKGGIIVFSTDVNAVMLSKNKLVNWLKQKASTLSNRFFATNKIDRIAQAHELVAWTIGHYLDGRYTAKDGRSFGENSLSVEMIGIETSQLISIAEEMCAEFQQESVLVKDYSSDRILLVNPN